MTLLLAPLALNHYSCQDVAIHNNFVILCWLSQYIPIQHASFSCMMGVVWSLWTMETYHICFPWELSLRQRQIYANVVGRAMY